MVNGLLQLLELRERKWPDIMAGDENWTFSAQLSCRSMVARRQSEAKETKAYARSEKVDDLPLFQSARVLAVPSLRDNDTFHFDFLINAVFPEIRTKITEERPQNDLKIPIRDLESAPCHNSRQTSVEIEKFGLSRIPHRPYSPEISPCNLWLFVFFKK
jgi:hypothetical protein